MLSRKRFLPNRLKKMKPAKRYLVDKNYLFYTSDGTRLKGQKAYKAELKQREESQEIQERRRLEREGQSLQADKKPAGGPPFDVKERKVTLINSEGSKTESLLERRKDTY